MKQKVLIACNTLTSVQLGAYMDHMAFAYAIGRNMQNFDFYQLTARRMSIDRFRNFAADYALKLEMDYLMFIDDDMRFENPKTVFPLLQKTNYDIIAALNYIRGFPFDIMAFKYADKKNTKLVPFTEKDLDGTQLVDCVAVGTAVCLIKTSVFKEMSKPYFVTSTSQTEDIYFCLKAQEQNHNRLKIGMHAGVVTGHILDPEVISIRTKKALKHFCISLNDLGNVAIDRGEEYVAENIEPRVRN